MPSPEQIDSIHRLHHVENWSLRKIARHLKLNRRTVAKYREDMKIPSTHQRRVRN